jgi:hypothetical protein
MAVTHSEYHMSPRENWGTDGFKATRRLECAWTDRKSLVEEILRPTQDTGLEYPNLTGTNAYAARAAVEPHPGAQLGTGSTASYEKALVTVEYETVNDQGGIRESIEPTAEFLTLNNEGYKWKHSFLDLTVNVDPQEAPGFLKTGLDYVVERPYIDTIPSKILDYVGAVNHKAVTPTSAGMQQFRFEAETLLFNPPTCERVYKPDGTPSWRVTLRFTYKPNWDQSVAPPVARGWNHFWVSRKVNGTVLQAYMHICDLDGNETDLYHLQDFSVL